MNPIPLIAGMLCLGLALQAQEVSRYTLKLNSGSFIPASNISADQLSRFQQQAAKTSGKSFAVIQFEKIPTEAQKQQLKQAGIQLLDYIPDNAYTATISQMPDLAFLQQLKARSVIELTAAQKMSPQLSAGDFPPRAVKIAGTVDVWISFPESFSLAEVTAELRARSFDILSVDLKDYRIVAVRTSVQKLGELALLPCVDYVQAVPGEDEPLSPLWANRGKDGMRGSILNAPISQGGKNLKGAGVVIGVGDDSDPQPHPDFSNRLISRAAAQYFPPAGHGVHVTGIAGGAGVVNEVRTGFAPKSSIITQLFSGIINNAPVYVNEYGMVITNNSYGNNVTECSSFGVYDMQSRLLDQQAFDLPYLQNVFAAGNSGLRLCPPYPDSFRTVLGSYQSSKNVLSVANARPHLGTIFINSSRGPTRDGRVKPEITGIGTFITSAGPYATYYFENTGTSMSAPAISGGMALLVEKYRLLHAGSNPKNGLLKALVCNSGEDWGVPGPDFTYGYGMANFWRANDMLENNRLINATVAPGPPNTHTITVPGGLAELKVMLYWNDPGAAPVSAQSLVNNLDLELETPSAATLLPLILDTLPQNIKNPAQPGVDLINNMEQVVVKNPAAGNYTIRIKPTLIAENPSQEYFVVYDYVPAELKLVTPLGGEAYLHGENLLTQWDSYGDPANTFTVEYSVDNGTNWTLLNSNIPAHRRTYYFATPDPNEWFIVPAVTTDQARMRVTKNGTGLVSTSLPFVIHDTLFTTLAADQCEGYMTINWTAVPFATGYEVMMLQGTEMTTIATVSSSTLTYTVGGLNKDSVYWMTARPLIGASNSPGRRGVAVSRKPDSGTCIGPNSFNDGDIKIDSILSPLRSGRLLTSTALGNSVPVTIRIKNLDDAITSGDIIVSYKVGVNPTISETITMPNIAPGATYTHTFAPANNLDLSAVGTYSVLFTVTPQSVADPYPVNNSVTRVIKQLDNPPLANIDYLTPGVPYFENFDAAPVQSHSRKQIGLDGLDKYDFANSNDTGRIRTYINSGMAYSGNRALTLDAFMFHSPGVTDSLTGTFNLDNYDASTDDIRLEFRYKNHLQTNNAANRVWIRGDDTQNWIEAYNLFANQNANTASYKLAHGIELSDLLLNASPSPQNFSTSFQVRWGQWGRNMTADNFGGAGYSFDDIRIYRVTDDMQMMSIDTPIVNSCGLSANTPVRVTVRNSRNSDITDVPVRYRINGGAWTTENIPSIPANDTVQYTFTGTANMLASGNYFIEAEVTYTTDSYDVNDTTSITITNIPIVTVTSTTPHLQDFEASNGDWYVLGNNSSWQYGTPSSYKINRAASGSKAWKTTLSGNYTNYESGYLYSPCYNVSSLTHPTLSFSIALDLEDCGATICDGAYVDYSLDGKTWTRLGANGQGTNWYNKAYAANNMWSIQNYHRWHVVTIPLTVIPAPITQMTQLRFRIAAFADPEVNREGIAIDDIHVYNNPNGIYDVTGVSPVVNQPTVSGSNWIHFIEAGTSKLVASVNPNGQNMGSTDAQSYVYTGTTRISSLQYYHNRNITLKPATVNLASSATVRFYFTDAETELLLNSSNCSFCTKPAMAYELGVTKYSDPNDANEDGTLANNTTGIYSFITPANTRIVPFDKGYYAEFNVSDFSEFWLNNGWLNGITPLPLKLLSFTATKKNNNDVLLEWVTAEEMNVDRFEVEVAAGNTAYQLNQFSKVGVVLSQGNSTTEQRYSLPDAEPGKSGVRYYRLRMVDKDGTVRYSVIRPVSFSNEVNWQVYPNPTDGLLNLVLQGNNGDVLDIKVYDATGRLVKQLQQTTTGFVQKVFVDLQDNRFAPGLYLLEATTSEQRQTFRVVKQK